MKRYLYLFPLMAFTAASLSLSACDDKKKDETAAEQTSSTEAPATTDAMTPSTTDSSAMTSPVADATAASVVAKDATAFATAVGAANGAVFMTLHNGGTTADKLIGASSDVANSVEIHESAVDAATGTMTMRKTDGVVVEAGQDVALKADGLHIMLLGLKAPLTEGQSFTVTLDFDKGPDVSVPVTVTAPGAGAAAATTGMDHTMMDHGTSPEADDTTATPSGDATATTPSTDATPSTMAPTTDTSAPAPSSTDAPSTTDAPKQ